MREIDFCLQKRLQTLDPGKWMLYNNTMLLCTRMLNKYLDNFPTFTDHSILHVLDVVSFCNQLIGLDQAQKLNAGEIYILLTACALHDAGMGLSESDYKSFLPQVGADQYLEEHPNASRKDILRRYHHEFGGLFIKKYSDFLEIPGDDYTWAIIQVARGHRKTDLFDPKEYPSEYILSNGEVVHLAYLAAIIRAADELDVSSGRNLKSAFGIVFNEDDFLEIDKIHFGRHDKIYRVSFKSDRIVMEVDPSDAEIVKDINSELDKIRETLDYCIKVVDQRTPFIIAQRTIGIEYIKTLQTNYQEEDNTLTIKLYGSLDENLAKYLDETIAEWNDNKIKIILDIEYVNDMTMLGIRVLFALKLLIKDRIQVINYSNKKEDNDLMMFVKFLLKDEM